MTELLIKINEAKTTESLMIYEAQTRQKYYKCFNEILNEEGFCFTTRSRRPPRDALNAMISFGNTMLYQQLAGEIRMTSLDIRFGILHNSKYRAESLNLDLADLFKPVIVDRTIFTLVNRKMISPYKDFKELKNGGVYLNETGRYKYIREFENKLSTQIKTGKAYKTYHELLREEVRKIESFFRKKEAYKPYKYVN